MSTNQTIHEDAVLAAIKSGMYRNHFLVYNRKSTDEPNNQKNSIKYQKAENNRYAERHHLPIADITLKGFAVHGIISEKHSGFKDSATMSFGKDGTVQYKIERPKFFRLVQFLNKGYFKGVIFLCWDRASRNGGDNTIIDKLMKQGKEFRFALASYDATSSGALHQDIDGVFAIHHSRQTSEKVSLNIRDQRQKGICTYKAPVGYLNQGIMEHKPFDPVRAPIIKQLFEKYASGSYSLSELARWANRAGLTMPPVRRRRTEEEILAEDDDDLLLKIQPVERPLTYNNVHKILTNPFYTGMILGTDGMYVTSASHKALVSDDLFKTVQTKLRSKKVSLHYTDKIDYLYRGILRCGLCDRVYTPYGQKGILYFGARCAKSCTNDVKNINLTYLEESIGKLLEQLSFTDAELAQLDAGLQANEAVSARKRKIEQSALERRKRKLREDLAYLSANRLVLLRIGVYTPESYLDEELKLNTELQQILHREAATSTSPQETVNDVRKLSELIKSLYYYYKNANSDERERYVRTLISELSYSEKTLKIKCKNGLQVLESRFYTCGDPTTWISEVVKSNISNIHQSTQDLKQILGTKEHPPPT